MYVMILHVKRMHICTSIFDFIFICTYIINFGKVVRMILNDVVDRLQNWEYPYSISLIVEYH